MIAFILFGLMWYFEWGGESETTQVSHGSPRLPPLYEEFSAYELALPQHNPNLPFPEGRNGKYLWAANHVHGMLARSMCHGKTC